MCGADESNGWGWKMSVVVGGSMVCVGVVWMVVGGGLDWSG